MMYLININGFKFSFSIKRVLSKQTFSFLFEYYLL